MSTASRISAAIAYVPIVGWLYVLVFRRNDELAMFHVRQAIGLCAFLVVVFVGWLLLSWLISWIPYLIILGPAMFALVMASYALGIVSWAFGIAYALLGRPLFMPIFGRQAAAMRL